METLSAPFMESFFHSDMSVLCKKPSWYVLPLHWIARLCNKRDLIPFFFKVLSLKCAGVSWNFAHSWSQEDQSYWLWWYLVDIFVVLSEIFQQQLDGLPLNLAQTMTFPLRMISNIFGDPVTFHLEPASGQNYNLSNTFQIPAELFPSALRVLCI